MEHAEVSLVGDRCEQYIRWRQPMVPGGRELALGLQRASLDMPCDRSRWKAQ